MNSNKLMKIYGSVKQAVYAQMTKSEMQLIAKNVLTDYQVTGKLPTSDDFTQWLKKSITPKKKCKRPVGIDYFGQKYLFVNNFNEDCSIISNGPDKKLHTKDDIKVEFSVKVKPGSTSRSK